MKKISEDLNPKCEKISQQSYDYLFKVSGQAESLAWDMHILADYLDEDAAMGYDGWEWLQNMAARIDAISNEIVNVINILDSEDKTTQ
jgi:hypothetical protein